MPETLLKTKLYIPPTRSGLVSRPRLIERLNQGLRGKLTLISAPPGFGKTTLLSEWVANFRLPILDFGLEKDAKSKIQNPIAWLSLDEQDNDPARFWSYVIAALETIAEDVGADALTLLLAPQAPPIETTLTTLINAATNIPHHIVLILDDYHIIVNNSIHQALTFLLDHLPPQMHLVMTSRVDPPLPLNRLRVRNQLTELRDADLRFTLKEAVTFLNQVMGLNLSPDDIIALENRTEGWVAGLQLAALSMQGHADTQGFVKAFTGSHRYVIDYLAEEVLARQPEPVQQFLLYTSILERMCGSLCDTLLSRGAEKQRSMGEITSPLPLNGQETLEHLEAANLFIIPLDNERRWYRYHHLFADFLREHLRQKAGRQSEARLHRRAAEWYAANGLMTEAVRHALAAPDPEWATQLIEQVIIDMLAGGEVATVSGWLNALPQPLLRARPRLLLGLCWTQAIYNEWEPVPPLIPDIERGLQTLEADSNQDPATVSSMWGELAALKAMMMANREQFQQAIELCHEALTRLPQENLLVHSIISMILGSAYEAIGDLDKASQALNQALNLSRNIDAITIALPTTGNLCRIQEDLGQLPKAIEFYRQSLEMVEERTAKRGQAGQPLLIAGWTYVNLADLLREQNDLEAAQHHLTIGLQLSQQLYSAKSTPAAIGQIILARILHAQNDKTGALQAIERALEAVDPEDPLYVWIGAVQTRLWLAQGNLAAAARWAKTCGLPLDEGFNFHRYPGEYSTLARVYVAQEQFDEALTLLKRMQAIAEASGKAGRLLEILMLQALTLHAQGHAGQALAPLTRAISLAEPGGFVRTFADEGPPMAQLLNLAKTRGVASNPAYLDKLLAAFGAPTQPEPPTLSYSPGQLLPDLIEPLSERELEVLRLVADGLSNKEIAEKLVITVGTAKTHTINIYRKLDVRSRTQAVARATEIGLL